ncbi:Rne/Rng family ribonuclease [Phaeovulum vinaykumarii]|nr:ribonuclease E/G [Phaeovulum vinaykumarii]
MAKKMLIDATHAEETRVVVVDGNKVEEFDFETVNKRQLAGNIYLAKVTRVEPSLQAAFVDYGGNRHGFLAFAEIHPDYYQIPVADRQALLEEERALAEREEAEETGASSGGGRSSRRRSRRGGNSAPAALASSDPVTRSDEIPGMEVRDPDAEGPDAEGPDAEGADAGGGNAGGDVAETPVAAAPEAVADTTTTDAATDASTGDDTTADAAPEAAPEAQDAEAATDENGAEDNEGAKAAASADHADQGDDETADDAPYVAADHAADTDDEIESVADEDVAEEIAQPRKPRPRRYKIQEVIKVRQIMLVQVVKEERGNKGAALTTYLSLAGRYCVLMPNTARGGGISRKITNAADRKKLKEIAAELEVPQGAGLIIRTAGSQRTRTEIRRDYEYLMRLWEQIRDLTLKSVAPAPIYEEGDLIKRSIRDLYSKEIDEVLVEGDRGYRAAKDFMKMIMPSHAKNVKHYAEPLPLFARYQVESYLAGMFNPVVQLKSGGYIVIGVTEALVAIDVNSGRATKEGSIEETALKTNLEAAEEIARQLRLRDLAGLIVIDFIDMEERKNNAAVEKRLKEKLKTDRARIQVGRISGFGLLEMSRQRLRPGMIEMTTQPCPHCHGTGLIRSDESLALQILRQIEEEGTRKRSREVLLRAPVAVANYLMNAKREHIAGIEARYGLSVRIEADGALVSPDYTLEKFKTATRVVPEPAHHVVSVDARLMAEIDEDEAELEVEEDPIEEVSDAAPPPPAGEEEPRKKKRRRRRKKRSDGDAESGSDADAGAEGDEDEAASEETGEAPAAEEAEAKPARRRRSRRSARLEAEAETAEDAASEEAAPADDARADPAAEGDAPAPKKPRSRSRSTRSRKKPETEAPAESAPETVAPETAAEEAVAEAPTPAVTAEDVPVAPADAEAAPEAAPVAEVAETAPEAVVEAVAEAAPAQPAPTDAVAPAQPDALWPNAAPDTLAGDGPSNAAPGGAKTGGAETATGDSEDDADRPKRRGWWSLAR